ncbi:MAG: ABC transporter permease [Candidatus Omnitrophica bacterium]|nr:ABC transporter permease [Candidatus Omnitrophota bacterium]
MIWMRFRENRLALACLWVLGALYGTALFAEILAPYSFQAEVRNFSYAPPSPVSMIDQGRISWPFVRGAKLTFDEYRRRIYVLDEKKYPLKLFVLGDEYRFWGLIPSRLHLFGVDTPGRIYLLGADSRGRDIFSRLLYGGRISLSIGLIGVLISFIIGLLVGGAAGYFGGKIDNVLMRLCEMVMMVPGFYLLLALRAAVPDNFNSVQIYFMIIVILSFMGWAGLARVIRGMCLSLRERDYVLVAKTLGLSDLKIIVRHILPHTVSYSIAAVMLSIPGYILSESALSLIGLGIQDPYASWGNMLSEAMSIVRISFAPWILWPAFFIFLSVVCFNMLGDALRDAVDPMMTGKK